jgi:hypothetical protein
MVTSRLRPRSIRAVLAGAVVLLHCSGSVARAQDQCNAILRSGVFDTTDTLDLKSRWERTRSITCQNDLKFNLGEPSLTSSDFCNREYKDIVVVDQYVQAVRRASAVIATAWVECLRLTSQGLFHYFTTTPDPKRFQYTALFKSVGQPRQTRVRDWSIEPRTISCKGSLLRKGSRVDDTTRSIDCARSPDQTVTIRIETDSGKADPVVLPAVSPDAYVLIMNPVDDDAQCSLQINGGAAQTILSLSYGLPTKTLFLTPSLTQSKKHWLRCTASDRHPNSIFQACWSYSIRLVRNGNDVINWTRGCCGSGCPGGQVLNESFEFTPLLGQSGLLAILDTGRK